MVTPNEMRIAIEAGIDHAAWEKATDTGYKIGYAACVVMACAAGLIVFFVGRPYFNHSKESLEGFVWFIACVVGALLAGRVAGVIANKMIDRIVPALCIKYLNKYLKKLVTDPMEQIPADERIYLNMDPSRIISIVAKYGYFGYDPEKKLWFTDYKNAEVNEITQIYKINEATSPKARRLMKSKLSPESKR